MKNDVNLNHIKSHFKSEDTIQFIEEDGLKMLWKDKWIHIRKSNTEPIIRIISEAITVDIAEELIDSIHNILY